MANVTITGTFADPNGTVPTSGVVTFTLDGQMITAGGTIIAVKPESATLTTGGFSILLGSTTDSTPANRTYGVTLTALVEGVNVTQAIGSFQLAPSPSSQNLVDLILQSAVGTSATLSLLTLSVLRLNNIRYADQFPGADAGAKISAAIADLPGTGGTVDARGLQGTQAGTATVTIPANVTVLLGAISYTINFAGIGFKTSGRGARLIGQDYDTSIILQNSTSAPYAAVRPEADGFTLRDFQISGEVPSGSEGAPLAGVMLSKSSLLSDGLIEGLYITGTNGGIYGDTLVPSGIKNIVVRNNKVRVLHFGIVLGPYAGGNISSNVLCEDNDVEVSAVGAYASFEYARAIQIVNCSALRIVNNKAIGGFASIETYGNAGNPSTSRPHRADVQIIGNVVDSFISFAQVDGGCVANNVVDMALRDGSWPAYDNSTTLSTFGTEPGIEFADINYCTCSGNTIKSPVGPAIDFGAALGSSVTGNIIYNASNTASPVVGYSGGILLNYGSFTDCIVANNAVFTSKTFGIAQVGGAVIPAANISRIVISGNTVRNTQRHGMHFRNIINSTISGNIISAPNLASGSYNGIDFTDDGGGATYAVSGVTIEGNRIDGGAYCIYQPYIDNGGNRLTIIRNNVAMNPTTAAYLIYGHRSGNWAPVESSGYSVGLTSTHLDVSGGIDFIYLDPGGSASLAFIDNGTNGDEITIYLVRSDTTIVHASGRLELAGSTNIVTPAAGSMVRFRCRQDANHVSEAWIEISRMIA